MVLSLIGTILFSIAVEIGAVMFTRFVVSKSLVLGAMTTGFMAIGQFVPTIVIVRHYDWMMWPAAGGHIIGFFIGMKIPVRAESGTAGPTTGAGSQNSGPS